MRQSFIKIIAVCKFLCFGLFFISSAAAQVQPLVPGQLSVLKYDTFKKQAERTPERLTVLYFWATWCAPCVQKIHYFEQLRQDMSNKNVRVLLVSIDDIERIQKVKDIIKAKKLNSEVVLLEMDDQNALINAINPQWEGSVPYTMLVKDRKTVAFYEGELTKEELFAMTKNNL